MRSDIEKAVDREVDAMSAIVALMADLDYNAQDRVAGWVYDRWRRPLTDFENDENQESGS